MILFNDDWAKYNSAIIDTQTKNYSFLRIATMYKEMRVKNWAFPLSLMQKELQGIDPHASDLSDEIKYMISVECNHNPWYALREVIRIPSAGGGDPIPLIANRGNMCLFWCFFNHIDVLLIQPRQTGKSVSTDSVTATVQYLSGYNTHIQLITKDNELRLKNIERLKGIRNGLPQYLYYKDVKDADNQVKLTYTSRKNSYNTSVSQKSETSARNIGRGLTAPIFHIDESPFISNIGATLPAALAAGTAARESAEKNNGFYGNIFTTTAGKKDDRDGKYMYKIFSNAAIWSESFLDSKDQSELKKRVRKQCHGERVIINGTFSHRQLGYSDAWLLEAIANAGGTPDEIDRDFFNKWTSGTQKSPLSIELNERILNAVTPPLYENFYNEGYLLNWFVPEDHIETYMETSQFVLGSDTSDAIGRDAISFILMNVKDLRLTATANINETNLFQFSLWLAAFLIRYDNVTLVMERNRAQGIIDVLLIELPKHGIDPFKRIFNKVVDEKEDRKEDWRAIQKPLAQRDQNFYTQFKKDFGFYTGSASRDVLYGRTVLQQAAKRSGHLVYDKRLSEEIRGLVIKNGRIDHINSGHDDMVIGWLLNHWLLIHGRNLNYYGIDTAIMMSMVTEDGKEVDAKVVEEKKLIAQWRKELEIIHEDLSNCDDGLKQAKLESRLKTVTRELMKRGQEVINMDTLIKSAKEERLKRRNKTHYRKNKLSYNGRF
ncbi:hypothetical protein [Endozoicomonas sp. ONNA1]|uniref:hypothetical protein n=1 Tax=Endozoicomonas sp. ONNA1 TaxID=2828740 RepID=UPI0021478AE3|nr:hypothetical protein [Endozoicomonas sp. ONNA1]